MGRHNGIWSKLHEPIWDHAKTHRAAAVLVAAGVPAEYAHQVVVGALHRLTCWALRDGDSGRTGSISDSKLAVLAWPESAESRRFPAQARTGQLLRTALRAGGFLECPCHGSVTEPIGDAPETEILCNEEVIHDFADHCKDVLGDRRRKRGKEVEKEERSAKLAGQTAIPPGNIRGKSADRRPTVGGQSGGIPRREAEAAEEAAAAAFPPPPAAAAESPATSPPDPLAARLTDRLRWGTPATVEAMLAELRAEGTPEAWLEARVEATPNARAAPWDWAKAARQARPKASPATDTERILAQRSAETHAGRYREHLRAGRAAQAESSWAQVVSFAKTAGIDPETLRHDPLDGRGSAA